MPDEQVSREWSPDGHDWGYWEIADDVAARIRSGVLRPGDRIPSRSRLAAMYRVSLATVARAVTVLQAWGLVRGARGQAMYVVVPPAGGGGRPTR